MSSASTLSPSYLSLNEVNRTRILDSPLPNTPHRVVCHGTFHDFFLLTFIIIIDCWLFLVFIIALLFIVISVSQLKYSVLPFLLGEPFLSFPIYLSLGLNALHYINYFPSLNFILICQIIHISSTPIEMNAYMVTQKGRLCINMNFLAGI